MANPTKGEVSLVLFEDDPNLDTRRYTLKFSNSGHREMEDFLDIEQSEVMARIDTGRVGARILTALLFGATRKFHRRELPSIVDIDELMDTIADDAEDFGKESRALSVALIAAYTRSNPSDIEAQILGEEPASRNGSNGASEEVPKDQDKPTRKPKQKPAKESANAGGSSS